jgi:hypothetical protein
MATVAGVGEDRFNVAAKDYFNLGRRRQLGLVDGGGLPRPCNTNRQKPARGQYPPPLDRDSPRIDPPDLTANEGGRLLAQFEAFGH